MILLLRPSDVIVMFACLTIIGVALIIVLKRRSY